MATPAASHGSEALPLLCWNELMEIRRIQCEREQLIVRIRALPAHCHRRVELAAVLRTLTARQLELEGRLT